MLGATWMYEYFRKHTKNTHSDKIIGTVLWWCGKKRTDWEKTENGRVPYQNMNFYTTKPIRLRMGSVRSDKRTHQESDKKTAPWVIHQWSRGALLRPSKNWPRGRGICVRQTLRARLRKVHCFGDNARELNSSLQVSRDRHRSAFRRRALRVATPGMQQNSDKDRNVNRLGRCAMMSNSISEHSFRQLLDSA